MSGLYIAGAGASGMMAAIAAARAGAHPVIIAGRTAPGKKILMTGNGRCNFTNLRMKKECYHSAWPDGPMKVLKSFGSRETIAFFQEMGMLSCERDGYVYPRSLQASSVREVLLGEIRRLKIQMIEEDPLEAAVFSEDGGFLLTLASGKSLSADRLIMCTGGMAAPATGSDGSGLEILKTLGIKIIPTVPALTGLLSDDPCCSVWHGVRTHGKVTVCDRYGKPHSDTGELQLMKNGISGIPVFQVSRHIAYVLKERPAAEAEVDFMPEEDADLRRILDRKDLTAAEALHGAFPIKLAEVFLKRLGVRPDTAVCQADPKKIMNMIHSFRLTVRAVRNYDEAQVTAGGVDLRSVDLSTMESRNIPGLYFAGEILDADGICGGYNLQWAFSTGYTAGVSAASYMES
ncbi:MAG: aminoacetone oxidase family FAD-binding enzyme [Lachnospiraceae bacterium]|nr:aminoacetone oxidase family FAD-binding enzyme [Lachnospiraceae bacterium]